MRKIIAAVLVLCFGLGLFAVSFAGGKEEKISLDKVPAAVKATILKYAKASEIEEIEVETKDGKVIYEVEIKKDGKELELKIDADGNVLKEEYEDDDDEDDDDEGDDDEDDD